MQKKQPRSARFIAAQILSTLYASRSPVKPLLEKEIRPHAVSEKDRNLIVQLVYGILRRRQSVDLIISQISATPLAKLDPLVHQILAVGVYQLFYLDRIPPSAAVNEAVNCGRAAGLPKRLQGFINGVLRQTIRQKERLLTVLAAQQNTACYNHPDWLVQRWTSQFGPDTAQAICRANNQEPELVLRINTARISREEYRHLLQEREIVSLPGRYGEAAIILPKHQGAIAALPGYHEGFFQVQDEAAQLATLLLQPFIEGGRYLDGCAGLGGKTSHMLEFAVTKSCLVTAVEPETYRVKKMRENVARLFDTPPLTVHQGDLLQFSPANDKLFDGILIDAPCSGTGVTGRHPDIRWNRRPEDFLHYQQQQLQLARHAATLLKPGGVLVYATCSLEAEENEEVVARLCQDVPELELTDCGKYLPPAARSLVSGKMFKPLPGTLDGFFAARLSLRRRI